MQQAICKCLNLGVKIAQPVPDDPQDDITNIISPLDLVQHQSGCMINRQQQSPTKHGDDGNDVDRFFDKKGDLVASRLSFDVGALIEVMLKYTYYLYLVLYLSKIGWIS